MTTRTNWTVLLLALLAGCQLPGRGSDGPRSQLPSDAPATARPSSEDGVAGALAAASQFTDAVAARDFGKIESFISPEGVDCGGDGEPIQRSAIREGISKPASCFAMFLFDASGYRARCGLGSGPRNASLAEVVANPGAWTLSMVAPPRQGSDYIWVKWSEASSPRHILLGFRRERGRWQIAYDLFC